MGYSSHFLWSMHHTLALHSPKLGELVAFRRVVGAIPKDTAVDEAAIEAAVKRSGYAIRYAGDAIVFNAAYLWAPNRYRDNDGVVAQIGAHF